MKLYLADVWANPVPRQSQCPVLISSLITANPVVKGGALKVLAGGSRYGEAVGWQEVRVAQRSKRAVYGPRSQLS